jgi:hypothetical protein
MFRKSTVGRSDFEAEELLSFNVEFSNHVHSQLFCRSQVCTSKPDIIGLMVVRNSYQIEFYQIHFFRSLAGEARDIESTSRADETVAGKQSCKLHKQYTVVKYNRGHVPEQRDRNQYSIK